MAETLFKTLPVAEIHPDKNQPRKFFDDESLKELTESIKTKGVLQPLIVRPNGKGFILVCGERRLKASISAGLSEVPTVVRNLTEQEALEIQFIENIQREDVHPMDEATTFKQMIENKVKPYTIADVAAKINKPESFVVHRLALNNLIPEFQKDFWNDKFLIGHAVIFARLSEEDQKRLKKEGAKDYSGDYKSIRNLNEYIERNIMRLLSKAPFKKDDPSLNPEMGACTNCAFRTGANPSLFNDLNDKDRCAKRSCFDKKIKVYTLKKITESLEQEPDVVYLLSNYYSDSTDPSIIKLLESYKIKPLSEYHDFSEHIAKGDMRVKGIWINGDKVGSIQYVALSEKKKAAAAEVSNKNPGSLNLNLEIEGIKQRTKRAAELDDLKVWDASRQLASEKELMNDNDLSPAEITALIVAFYEKIGYTHKGKMERLLQKSSSLSIAKSSFSMKTLLMVARIFLTDVLNTSYNSHITGGAQHALMNVLKDYLPEKISSIEKEFREKREKREERAKARIKALQDQHKKKKPDTKKSKNKS